MDEEARAERERRRREGAGWDSRPLVAMCVGAVCLTAMEYLGNSGGDGLRVDTLGWVLERLHGDRAGPSFWSELRDSPWGRLVALGWWAGWRVLGYFLLPVVVLKLQGQRLVDNGLQTRGWLEHAWMYVLAYAVVLVCVIVVSFTEEFSTYYPFYKLASRSWFDLIVWELLYAAQFFSLEFFFRGWWLAQCKAAMGSHAIFAMVVPYCMIHYGKPGLEAVAAIVAGVVLGTLAMKTRSIWSGFLIHVSVAVSMDVAALLQTTGLPTVWWPEL